MVRLTCSFRQAALNEDMTNYFPTLERVGVRSRESCGSPIDFLPCALRQRSPPSDGWVGSATSSLVEPERWRQNERQERGKIRWDKMVYGTAMQSQETTRNCCIGLLRAATQERDVTTTCFAFNSAFCEQVFSQIRPVFWWINWYLLKFCECDLLKFRTSSKISENS